MYGDMRFQSLRQLFAIARVVRKEEGLFKAFWYVLNQNARSLGRFVYNSYSILYARVFNKPLIYTVGDSHVKAFRWNRLFIVRHLGAATAHNLGKEHSKTGANRKLIDIMSRVDRKAVVLLSFGEIDCRIHIYHQYKKRGEVTPIRELIDDTILNYGNVLQKLRDLGVNFVVYGVPPATRVRNEYRYRFYATPEMHSQISRMFNDRLKGFCEEKGYRYIDVHSRFSDDDGFMLKEYAADEIHLNGKAVDFVRSELHEKLGIRI